MSARPPVALRVAAGFGVAAWLGAHLLGAAGATAAFDRTLYDELHALRAPLPPDEEIAVVLIGDRDIEALAPTLGRWPWRSREAHVEALRFLHARGARSVAYDILFGEPSGDEGESDIDLAEEIGLFGPVVLGCVLDTRERRHSAAAPSPAGRAALEASGSSFGTAPRSTAVEAAHSVDLPVDVLAGAASSLGHANATVDPDGGIRRLPLLIRHDDRLVPALALRAAMDALQIDSDRVVADLERGEIRLSPKDADSIHIPVDRAGNIWVNYERPIGHWIAYQYTDLEEAPVDAFEDRLVIVGVNAAGATDQWPTPVSSTHPGCLIHAQVLENILRRRFVRHIEMRALPSGAAALLVALTSCLLAVAAAVGAAMIRSPLRWALALATPAVALIACSLLLVGSRIWVEPTIAGSAMLVAGVAGAGYRSRVEAKERLRVRQLYERYLSPRVLETIIGRPDLVAGGGTRKELTIFFSDICEFTDFTERSEPEEVTQRLNEYFDEMAALVDRFDGTLDKFVGDEVVVFFGDPVAQDDHALRAVRMAQAMRARLAELEREWEERGVAPFRVRMGIATGFVTVGNFGSERFTDYTVIGRTVNLASRIMNEAPVGGLWVNARTYHLVKHGVDAEALGERSFRGISEPQEVYAVSGPSERSGS